MILSSTPLVLDFDPYGVRTEAEGTHRLGERVQVGDGREFQFIKVGASDISRGKLQLSPAQKTNHHNLAVAAASIGAKTVTVTPGATAVVAGEYNEGFLAVNDVDGEGSVYRIGSHPAADASTAFVVTLAEPITNVALTANSEVSLVHNAANGVVEGTVATRRAAGVPLRNISAGDFGWAQTKGVAAVLCDTATTLGAPQIAGAVAGSIKDQTDILGASSEVTVAWATIMAGVDTEYRPVVLTVH